ncbi:MAG: hypothetical protein ACYCXW_07195, partial [Solirubrobacteraceae bacterium]
MEIAPEELQPFEDDAGSSELRVTAPASVAGASSAIAGPSVAALATAGAEAVALPGIEARPLAAARRHLSIEGRRELLWIVSVYMATRVALLLAAFIQSRFGHAPFQNELANWDGFWYRMLANRGYPAYVSYGQTTLGFFPLFPLTIWPVEHVLEVIFPHQQLASTLAGALVSGTGGLI